MRRRLTYLAAPACALAWVMIPVAAAQQPPGTASLSPDQVVVGEPVVVSGDECYDGVVLIDVVPEGGDLRDLVDSAEVPTASDGTWSHEFDTTGYQVGAYDVAPIECVEPEDDNNRDVYEYDPLRFEVVEAEAEPPVTTPPTTAAAAPEAVPPAPTPAVAAPTYTG